MTTRVTTSLLLIAAALAWPRADAHAHIDLLAPTDRGCSNQKSSPCGGSCDTRTGNVSVFEPGATITVRWDETIDHPSHYRISFDSDGIDDFQDPTSVDDIQANPALPVLADGIADRELGGLYEYTVTLPNIECENCTLQLIQVMYDKNPPYGDDDLYYRCADLALRTGAGDNPDAGPSPDASGDPGDGDGDGGGGCSAGGGAPGAGFFVLLVVFALSRRRRALR
ncbi:MAG: hypothetical protein Tsb0020_44830 [Haliangiales bacterium]